MSTNIRTMYFRSTAETITRKLSHFETLVTVIPDKVPFGCVVTDLSVDGLTINYQVSSLHPLDVYSRKIGREIALGRLKSNPITLSLNGIPQKRHAILAHVLEDIVRKSLKKHQKLGAELVFSVDIGEAAAKWLVAHQAPATEQIGG